MSRATTIVLSGGCFWLKPVVIVFVILCSAVVVEWLVLKPCWCCMLGMFCVISGRTVFSRVLTIRDRREIGLYDMLSPKFLLGFGIGILFASFHNVW